MKKLLGPIALLTMTASCYASGQSKCLASIEGNPEFAPIAKVVQLGATNSQPIEILANQSLPTDEERGIIGKWITERQKCQVIFHIENESAPAALLAVMQKSQGEFIAAAVKLYNKKVTYGDFALERQKIVNQNEILLAEAKNNLKYQQNASQPRQESSYVPPPPPLSFQPVVPYQMPNNRPVITNCSRIGAQVSCASQ